MSYTARNFFKKTDDAMVLLESKNSVDVLDAISGLFDNMAQCKDMSFFLPQIINLIASENQDIKRLVCIFVAQYSSKNPDVCLLCVSTLQKGLKFTNHVIRGLSLRTLIHLHAPLIVQLQYQAVISVLFISLTDSSSYLKKIACAGIHTLVKNSPEIDLGQCFEILVEFLSSESDIVFGSALFILYFYFTARIDILHKNFFRLCNSLRRMDELYIPIALELLTIYSRKYFSDQRLCDSLSDSEETNQKVMDADFEFLLYSCIPLLSHRNSAVVTGVVRLIHYCAPESFNQLILEPMVMLLSTKPFLNDVLTYNIDALMSSRPKLFNDYIHMFFVRIKDEIKTKKKKVDILVRLINLDNCWKILDEFQLRKKVYVKYPDFIFAAYTVSKLIDCATLVPDMINDIFDIILILLKSNRECVLVLRALLQINTDINKKFVQFNLSSITERLIMMFSGISEPLARESIIWLVTENCRELVHLAPDMLRLGARTYCDENVQLMIQYVFNLAKYDQDHDIRDRCRFLMSIIDAETQKKLPKEILLKVIFAPKPTQNIIINIQKKYSFEIMTLSFYLNTCIHSYEYLPEFAQTSISPEIRLVPKQSEVVESDQSRESDYESEKVEESEDGNEDSEEEDTIE
ncbi:hypothetical protein MXB_4065 [Myxobolus squamalis]|nr:hypothetical protein MXB_4065 [Myxobolus squamalis]